MNQATEQAIDYAKQGANKKFPDWSVCALHEIRQYAKSHHYFSIEKVRENAPEYLTDGIDARAWGAPTREAIRDGIIKFNQYVKSSTFGNHGRPVPLFESLIYIGE